jgi:hypothetical protein
MAPDPFFFLPYNELPLEAMTDAGFPGGERAGGRGFGMVPWLRAEGRGELNGREERRLREGECKW